MTVFVQNRRNVIGRHVFGCCLKEGIYSLSCDIQAAEPVVWTNWKRFNQQLTSSAEFGVSIRVKNVNFFNY
jgi:hypothetical protein